MDSKSDESTDLFAAVIMFTPVTHPVLKSADPVNVSIFIKESK